MNNIMKAAIIIMCAAIAWAVISDLSVAQLTPQEMRAEPREEPRYRARNLPKFCVMEPAEYGFFQRARNFVAGPPKACYEQRIQEYFD